MLEAYLVYAKVTAEPRGGMIAGCVPLIVHAPHYPPLTLVYSCSLADIIRYIIFLIRYCHLVFLYDMSALAKLPSHYPSLSFLP
jgi:hypothetical protein